MGSYLSRGPTLNKVNDALLEEYIEAARTGDLDFLEEHTLLLNAKTASGDCALAASALAGQFEVVKHLVSMGSALQYEVKDNDLATPLMNACIHGDVRVVAILADRDRVKAKDR